MNVKSTVLFPILLIFLLTGSVRAHDWYDKECCSGDDCRPVPCEEIVETKEGFKWGKYLFRKKDEKPSKDDKCHVCIFRQYTPMCIYTQQNT